MNANSEAPQVAKESIELAYQLSIILNTGLDRHTLSLLISLCELGVNPESLAALLTEIASSSSRS